LKIKSIILLVLVLSINSLYAGCGSCPGDVKVVKKSSVNETKSNALIMSVPKDGNVNGLVITSCGTCNLGAKGKGCSLSVRIGEKIYSVDGTGIHDHGNAHGNEGFCSAVRVAWASGKIKKEIFYADSFILVGDQK